MQIIALSERVLAPNFLQRRARTVKVFRPVPPPPRGECSGRLQPRRALVGNNPIDSLV